ncbi:MAG: endonuclease VIII [Wenzhouxiangella sp.]|nr:MAG: endonuclease VIII [Wenzhouxiangella sp.]
MPEGPEIYRVARQVAGRVVGKPLTELWFGLPEPARAGRVLKGQQIEAVETRGKALLLRFESGQVVYTHNQLYGRWLFSTPDRRPDTRRQLRLAISSETDSALLYSASDIAVLEPDKLETHPFLARVGLDVLSSGADPEAIGDWISQPRFAGRQLAHLLLDQSFLAGVGNYLRSEILFVAGLPPGRRLRDLDDAERRGLADAVHTLMWRSVETGGLTNDPDRVRDLKKAGWRRRDYRHFVFSREGQACHHCNGPILRTEIATRRLYHCPRCQPKA